MNVNLPKHRDPVSFSQPSPAVRSGFRCRLVPNMSRRCVNVWFIMSRASSTCCRFATRIACHNAGSPPATRVVSRQPPAVEREQLGRRRRGDRHGRHMRQMTRYGERRIVLGRSHGRYLSTESRPKTAHFRDSRRPCVLGGRDHHRAAFEHICPRVLRSGSMIARHGVAAHKSRPATAGCQPGIDGRYDRFLGAARVCDQRSRRAHGRYLNHALGNRIDRRRNDNQLGIGHAVRQIGNAVIDCADIRGAASRLVCRRPTPMIRCASRRSRSARPIDPPISPTPTMATVSYSTMPEF